MNNRALVRVFYIAFSIFGIFSVFKTYSQTLTKYADAVEGIDADSVGIYIEDIVTGDVLLDVNGEKLFTPASVTKMLTIATLVETTNLDERFNTSVYLNGELTDSIFVGDIVVQSNGDPTLESSHFKEYNGFTDSIAANVCRLGIKSIIGSIEIIEPEWIERNVPSGWKDSDLAWPYGTGHFGLNYKDNKAVLTIKKDGTWITEPKIPTMNIIFVGKTNNDELRRERGATTLYTSRSGKKTRTHTIANPDPVSTLKYEIEKSLSKYDIIYEKVDSKNDIRSSTLIYKHLSPTLKQIAKSTMQRSDNMMAEGLLRIAHPGKPRAVAVREELLFWDKIGWDRSGMIIEDGSGLSRNNKISPYALADILAWMFLNSDNFNDFVDMFPVAAKSGTLRNFLKSNNLSGQFRAKTGSLNGVQCYAGYVMDQYGLPSHIVVVMINGMKSDRSVIKKNLELLLENYCTFVSETD